MAQPCTPDAPCNTQHVRALDEIMAWRRDVRRFRSAPVPLQLVDEVVAAVRLSPSVGLSEPTRLVRVESDMARQAVRSNFATCNAQALAGYNGEDARLYASLKLEGLDEAPVQLAVFADGTTDKGRKLGCRTMPETVQYSAVSAITLMWLAATARGLGLGWVSILDPAEISAALEMPSSWTFVAYLCLGWPAEHHLEPALQRAGWEARMAAPPTVEVR